MKNVTVAATEIKYVKNSLEVLNSLNEFGIEIGLDGILVEEYKQGLRSGIDSII